VVQAREAPKRAPRGAPCSGEDCVGGTDPVSASTPACSADSPPQLLAASEMAGCSGEESACSSRGEGYCASPHTYCCICQKAADNTATHAQTRRQAASAQPATCK